PAVPVQQADAGAPPSGPAKAAVTAEVHDVPEILREASAAHTAFSPAAAATSTPASLIAQLQEKPDGPHVGDVLAVLGRQLETAMKTNRVSQALSIVAGIVRAEQQVSDATRRRQYSIALKRMTHMDTLEAIATAD